jgi:phosphoribosylamine--glycine ligase
MGAFTCADGRLPFVSEGDTAAALELMRDVLRAVKTRTGQPYRGALYGQFMNTATGPIVVEFNVRLGDPEAINVLTLLQTPLVEVLEHIVQGDLGEVRFAKQATVSKYLVPPGYPDQAQTVSFALPMHELEAQGLGVRLASVTQEGARLRTAGSRALALVASDEKPECAAERIDRAIQQLGLGKLFHFRRDVGAGHVIARKVEHVAALRAGRGAV